LFNPPDRLIIYISTCGVSTHQLTQNLEIVG